MDNIGARIGIARVYALSSAPEKSFILVVASADKIVVRFRNTYGISCSAARIGTARSYASRAVPELVVAAETRADAENCYRRVVFFIVYTIPIEVSEERIPEHITGIFTIISVGRDPCLI